MPCLGAVEDDRVSLTDGRILRVQVYPQEREVGAGRVFQGNAVRSAPGRDDQVLDVVQREGAGRAVDVDGQTISMDRDLITGPGGRSPYGNRVHAGLPFCLGKPRLLGPLRIH